MTRARLSLFAGLALSLAMLGAACGDGSDTPEQDLPTATATRDANDFGPAPKMTKNITHVFPAHASTVQQSETRQPVRLQPGGVCLDVNFDDLPPADARWFRMAIDGVEQTPEITWFPKSDYTQATGCYATEQGLEPGRHQVAVSVQNPDNPSESPRQLVSWAFDVE